MLAQIKKLFYTENLFKLDPKDLQLMPHPIKYELEYKNEERLKWERKEEEKRKKLLEEKRDHSIKRAFTKVTINQAQKSSVHCFPSFADFNTSLTVKIVWFLITITSWSYWLYQTYGLYKYYLTYDTVSSYSRAIDTRMDFPAVTICNLNPYDGGVTATVMNNIIAAKEIKATNSTSLLKFTDTANSHLKSSLDNSGKTSGMNLYYQGFYIDQMLIDCEFNGKKCTYDDFYAYHDFNYGNCFRFNRNDPNRTGSVYPDFRNYPIKQTKKLGWENGLRLELYTGDQASQQQYVYKTGVRVIVHNQSISPFPDEDGIDVPVGKQTNIAIARTFIDRLPQPYSDCIDEISENVAKMNDILNEMFIQKQSNQIKQYQQQYCMKLCQQSFFVRECKCYSYAFDFLNVRTLFDTTTVTGCITNEDIECIEIRDVEFVNGDKIDKCYAKCPQACHEQKIDYKISQAAYPSQYYAKKLNEVVSPIDYYSLFSYFLPNFNYDGPTFDLIQSTALMLNVYYDTNAYTTIQESPAFTFDTLITTIGGNMGLFTGASILSLVEIIEYSISLIIVGLTIKQKTTIYI